MFADLFTQANAAILGGTLVHLVIGTIYVWGNITTAVTAHLRSFDSSITYSQTLVVYATAIGVQGFTLLLGINKQAKKLFDIEIAKCNVFVSF
jgi:glucose uptake protein GlcU